MTLLLADSVIRQPDMSEYSETLKLELTKEQALGITYLNLKYVLGMDFVTFHKIAEFAVGHPIWTHQFGDRDFIQREIFDKWDELLAIKRASLRAKRI